MNAGGDAAEQVVHISLEGMEAALRITGSGAKNLGLIIAAVLKEEHKTMGQTRLASMIKQGRPMTVFSVKDEDLKDFTKQAKRYGVLYCVVKSKYEKDGKTMVDIIAREDDAPKINRIVQNYKLASIDVGQTMEKADLSGKAKGMIPLDHPGARAGVPSVQEFDLTGDSGETFFPGKERASVREKLNAYTSEMQKEQGKIREQEKVKALTAKSANTKGKRNRAKQKAKKNQRKKER